MLIHLLLGVARYEEDGGLVSLLLDDQLGAETGGGVLVVHQQGISRLPNRADHHVHLLQHLEKEAKINPILTKLRPLY